MLGLAADSIEHNTDIYKDIPETLQRWTVDCFGNYVARVLEEGIPAFAELEQITLPLNQPGQDTLTRLRL